MDVGGKIIIKKFFHEKKINYNNILFLHSKKDKNKRDEYFYPFIKIKNKLT